MPIIVTRSPLRLMAHVLVAVPAVLLAIDMTISYRFIATPHSFETVVGSTVDEFGEVVSITGRALTQQGQAESRRDRAFAAVLLGGGLMSIAWAMRELVRPRLLLRADQNGLAVRMEGSERPMRAFGWEDIADIRSGLVDEDGDRLPAVSIRFHDHAPVADDAWLHIVSDDWSPPAHLIVPVLDRVKRSVPIAGRGG